VTDERDAPPRRAPGRPRAEPGTKLSTYVRTADYDRLVRKALEQDQSLSALVRDLLRLKLTR
jgi:hypothetical protein